MHRRQNGAPASTFLLVWLTSQQLPWKTRKSAGIYVQFLCGPSLAIVSCLDSQSYNQTVFFSYAKKKITARRIFNLENLLENSISDIGYTTIPDPTCHTNKSGLLSVIKAAAQRNVPDIRYSWKTPGITTFSKVYIW